MYIFNAEPFMIAAQILLENVTFYIYSPSLRIYSNLINSEEYIQTYVDLYYIKCILIYITVAYRAMPSLEGLAPLTYLFLFYFTILLLFLLT